ncbi:unnamed protein product, partial [Staurois parvus]
MCHFQVSSHAGGFHFVIGCGPLTDSSCAAGPNLSWPLPRLLMAAQVQMCQGPCTAPLLGSPRHTPFHFRVSSTAGGFHFARGAVGPPFAAAPPPTWGPHIWFWPRDCPQMSEGGVILKTTALSACHT